MWWKWQAGLKESCKPASNFLEKLSLSGDSVLII